MNPEESFKQAVDLQYNPDIFFGPMLNSIFIPRQHTVQSYRSQQRAAVQRRKAKKYEHKNRK